MAVDNAYFESVTKMLMKVLLGGLVCRFRIRKDVLFKISVDKKRY